MGKWFDKKFKFELNDSELNEILKRLSNTPAEIETLIKNIPEETLHKKPDGKWSIKENIGHLIDLEELHSARIDDFIANNKMLSPADLQNKKTDAADYNNKNTDEIINNLKKVRKDFIAKLNLLSEEVLNRKAIHPRLKQAMRPVDMAYFVAEHDTHHIKTIKTLIQQTH